MISERNEILGVEKYNVKEKTLTEVGRAAERISKDIGAVKKEILAARINNNKLSKQGKAIWVVLLPDNGTLAIVIYRQLNRFF